MAVANLVTIFTTTARKLIFLCFLKAFAAFAEGVPGNTKGAGNINIADFQKFIQQT